MPRLTLLLSLLATPLLAGSIQSGSITIAGIDGDAGWTVSNLSSSDFNVSYSGGNAASNFTYSTCTSPCLGFPIVQAGDAGPSGPLVVSGPMTLTFTPEPGSMGLVGLGVLLFLALGKLKSSHMPQDGLSDPDCDRM